MYVGLFLDLRNPPQWRRPWHALYGQTLERLEEADRLGIGAAWLTEHHLFEDGYLPQPLTFAAAIAARTRRMRIGTAILQAPLRHAVDIAEQAAIVDILSNGRMELGLGAGYRVPEWQAFGVDGRRRFELLEDRAREVRRLWDEGVTTPPPLQPRPPLWIGGESRRGARMAGRLGEGLLVINEDLLLLYQESLESAGHDPASARMGGCANFILADDPEQAWARIAPHLKYQWESYYRQSAEGRTNTREAPLVDPEALRTTGPPILPLFDVVTPDQAIERLRPWLGSLPVQHLYFWASIAGMPDDLADRHLELLARYVVPAFA